MGTCDLPNSTFPAFGPVGFQTCISGQSFYAYVTTTTNKIVEVSTNDLQCPLKIDTRSHSQWHRHFNTTIHCSLHSSSLLP